DALAAEELPLRRAEEAAAHRGLHLEGRIPRHHRARLDDQLLAGRLELEPHHPEIRLIEKFVSHGSALASRQEPSEEAAEFHGVTGLDEDPPAALEPADEPLARQQRAEQPAGAPLDPVAEPGIPGDEVACIDDDAAI